MTDPVPLRHSLKTVAVIARLNVGGPAVHVIVIDRGLRARGHSTLLVHGRIDEGEVSLEHYAREQSVRAVKLEDLGRRISPIGDVRAWLRLVALLFRESPDVVHTHTAKAGTLGRLAALVYNATRQRARRALVVHTFHGHVLEGYFNPAANVLVRVAERMLARITDRIVTLSPSQRSDIVGRFKVARESQTVVIPLGMNLDSLLTLDRGAASYREELSIAADEIVVGFVGRMVPIKDVATLVAAFAKALASRPRLRLVLAGGGPLRARTEDDVKRAGIAERVHFIGWTEDLRRLYATFDVLALSSLNEGTPVAAIEAMAAGRPIVSTAVGGVGDLVDHETTGLLVPPRDADALAAAIVRLADNPDERRRFGEEARLRVRARYTQERLVADIEQLYTTALKDKRGLR